MSTHHLQQRDAGEANDLTPHAGPQSLQSEGSQCSSYNEGSNSILLQESRKAQAPLGSLQNPFAVLDSDIDIPKSISHASDRTLEEILSLSMKPNA